MNKMSEILSSQPPVPFPVKYLKRRKNFVRVTKQKGGCPSCGDKKKLEQNINKLFGSQTKRSTQ